VTDNIFLVVGLGNPGPGYAFNRHNIGQMAVDVLAKRIGASWKSHKAGAVVAEGRLGFGGAKLILAKSTGYMNTSGRPVSALMKFYGVDLAHTIVLHDELDIPSHDVRIKVGGGHAGHNGLRDIIAACGGPDFNRIRIGIGRPPGQMPTADFVLKDFPAGERTEVAVTVEIAADAVEAIITDGVQAAQQKFHGK